MSNTTECPVCTGIGTVRESVLTPNEHMAYITTMVAMIYDCVAANDESSGHMTLNQMRVLAQLALGSLKDDPMTVEALSTRLQIPVSTVSGITADFLHRGIIKESIDPNDRRRRLLRFTEYAVEQQLIWCDLINEGRRKAVAKGLPLQTLYTVA